MRIAKCKVHPIKLCFVIPSLAYILTSQQQQPRHWLLTVHCIALAFTKITNNSTLSIIVINCIGTVIKVMYQLTWNTFTARQHSTKTTAQSRDLNFGSTRFDSEVSESCDNEFASPHLNNKQASTSVILMPLRCMCASECDTIRDVPYTFFAYVDFIHFVCVNKTTIANLNGGI